MIISIIIIAMLQNIVGQHLCQVKSSQVAFIEIVAIALSYNGIKNTVQ